MTGLLRWLLCSPPEMNRRLDCCGGWNRSVYCLCFVILMLNDVFISSYELPI
ncbi:hypothetical protein HanRHA438_Chr02g0081081 [Helianthus annuus]|nr:hypothetical protein HanIR_Chr13g0640711 [Helianthus annuus]KAJ0940234.1 hypothetical protein HanRHA438_Chr02g0081081 [Helianthus annuus]